MHQQRLPYHHAYNLVKSKRSCIAPNSGFIHQLKKLEKVYSINYQAPTSLTKLRNSISTPCLERLDPNYISTDDLRLPSPTELEEIMEHEDHALDQGKMKSSEVEEEEESPKNKENFTVSVSSPSPPLDHAPDQTFSSAKSSSYPIDAKDLPFFDNEAPLPPPLSTYPLDFELPTITEDPLTKSIKTRTPKRDSIIQNSPWDNFLLEEQPLHHTEKSLHHKKNNNDILLKGKNANPPSIRVAVEEHEEEIEAEEAEEEDLEESRIESIKLELDNFKL